jgi:MraZ protein
MEIYCAQIADDGRVTIPKEVRARLSSNMGTDRNAVFTHEAVFIERYSNWPYVKMWIGESSDRTWNEPIQSQRSQSRITIGRIAAAIDDSYRIHVPMGFRRETGLFNAIVWVIRGQEAEIWNKQRWELAGSVCLDNERVLLPQNELSGQVKRILESRGEVGVEAIAKIDIRGRLTMPMFLRKDFAEGVILTPGLGQCLTVYSVRQWQTFVETLPHPLEHERLRRLHRVVFSTAFSIEIEPSGRLAVPIPLQKYAKVGRDIIILISPSCTYLWDSDVWKHLAST